MAEKYKTPTMNKHGLVMPPDVATSKIESNRASHARRSFIDRHHLYFPRYAYKEAGSLAFEFREHRSNSIWLPRTQHNRLHRRYQGAVEADPLIFMPEDEVMMTYLDEVRILDELNVCVRAIEMIDWAIVSGQVKRPTRVLEHRAEKIERVYQVLGSVSSFELVSPKVVEDATFNANLLVAA